MFSSQPCLNNCLFLMRICLPKRPPCQSLMRVHLIPMDQLIQPLITQMLTTAMFA